MAQPFDSWPDYIKVTLGSDWATGDTPNPGEDLNEGDVLVLKRYVDTDGAQSYTEDGTTTAGERNRLWLQLDWSVGGYNVSYQRGYATAAAFVANPGWGNIGTDAAYWSVSGTGWTTDGATGLSWPVAGGINAASLQDPWWAIVSYATAWSFWTVSWGAWSTASFLTQRTTTALPGYSASAGLFSAMSEATEAEWEEAQGLGGPPIGTLGLMGVGR